MERLKFDYYYGNEAEQFNFYRIPKVLFTDKRFAKLSVEAKVLYGLLLDRMCLSYKNGWIDENNHVYIYFKLEDAMEYLSVGKDKGVKLFAELDSEKGFGLIKKKKQGLGKPNIIYVMNFTSLPEETDKTEEMQTSEIQNSGLPEECEVLTSEKPKSESLENQTSGLLKNRSLEFGKTESNNTNINNTELSDTNLIISNQDMESDKIVMRDLYKKIISENIEIESLRNNYGSDMADGILELMLDTVCSIKSSITINCEDIPKQTVKERLLKLNYSHIEYVLDCLKKNTTKVRNIKAYMLTMLYNSLPTIGHYYTAEVNHDLNNL